MRPGPGRERQLAHRPRRGHQRGGLRSSLGERGEERRAVGHATRHWSDVVERRRERDHSRDRDPAVAGLDRADAAARGRNAQRAAGVAAQRSRRHPSGQGGSAATARPAGHAVERPRVAHLVRGAARGELVRVCVAKRHHARTAQAPPCLRVLARHVALEHSARRRQRQAGHPVEVLHRERDAARERRGLAVAREPFVRIPRVVARQLGVEPHPRVDSVGRAVEGGLAPVHLVDAAEARLGQLERRELPLPQQRRRLQQA